VANRRTRKAKTIRPETFIANEGDANEKDSNEIMRETQMVGSCYQGIVTLWLMQEAGVIFFDFLLSNKPGYK
jgi:hypothetical protein